MVLVVQAGYENDFGDDKTGELKVKVTFDPFTGLVTVRMPVPTLARLDHVIVPATVVLTFVTPVPTMVVALITAVLLPAHEVTDGLFVELVRSALPEAETVADVSRVAVRFGGTKGIPEPMDKLEVDQLFVTGGLVHPTEAVPEKVPLPPIGVRTVPKLELVALAVGLSVSSTEAVAEMLPKDETVLTDPAPVPEMDIFAPNDVWGSIVQVPELPLAVMMPPVPPPDTDQVWAIAVAVT